MGACPRTMSPWIIPRYLPITHSWSYKVDMVGRQPIDDTIAVPGLTFKSLSHDHLPQWVREHTWDVTSFVAPLLHWGLKGPEVA